MSNCIHQRERVNETKHIALACIVWSECVCAHVPAHLLTHTCASAQLRRRRRPPPKSVVVRRRTRRLRCIRACTHTKARAHARAHTYSHTHTHTFISLIPTKYNVHAHARDSTACIYPIQTCERARSRTAVIEAATTAQPPFVGQTVTRLSVRCRMYSSVDDGKRWN